MLASVAFLASESASLAESMARLVGASPQLLGEAARRAGGKQQLAALDPTGWAVPQQVDYQLVRAEMNGVEFRHRVLRPWAIDPGFYNDVINRLGIAAKKGQIELELPLCAPPRAQPRVLPRASPCCAASGSLPP